MRSLVADIFHSLSMKRFLLSSANSSSCGPQRTRIGPLLAAGSSIRRSAAARGEDRAERADFDTGREQFIANQRVRRRQGEAIHRTARHQAVALRAGAAAILHRTCRANGCDDELAHDAINSATISPASAA